MDLKAKAKHWIAESRIASSAEVKIILTKVDAAFNQIAQLDKSLAEAHKQIKALNAGKRDLMAQMGLMVPVSELHAAKAESSKLRETIDGLSQLLRSTQAEAEKQSSAVQVRLFVAAAPKCIDRVIALVDSEAWCKWGCAGHGLTGGAAGCAVGGARTQGGGAGEAGRVEQDAVAAQRRSVRGGAAQSRDERHDGKG